MNFGICQSTRKKLYLIFVEFSVDKIYLYLEHYTSVLKRFKLISLFIKNFGEILFRLGSKVFLIITSLILNSEIFGGLVLFLVIESILTNVFRMGQDRRLLISAEKSKIPLIDYFFLLFLVTLIAWIILYFNFNLISLYFAVPISILTSIYYLINVRNRIENLKEYNSRRIFEFVVRFILAPFGLIWGLEYFVLILGLGYFILLILAHSSIKKIFVNKISKVNNFWNFTKFGLHSALTFFLVGYDKILISKFLGVSKQGEYSKIFSLISIVSIVYLFLSFLFEPKFYNSKNFRKIEMQYLFFSYILIIPLVFVISFFSTKFNLINSYDLDVFFFLGLYFLLFPIEFSKIYINTRLGRLNSILFAGIFQILFMTTWNIFLIKFSINSLVLSLFLSKVFGIIILIKKKK